MAKISRTRVLDVALDILLTEGLRRLSLTELGRRLGVVTSALYYHFPAGREEIVGAVLEREEEAILVAAHRAAARTHGTRRRLAALARASAAHVVRLSRLYPVSEDSADDIQGYLVARRRSFLERERGLIAQVLRDGMAAGEIRRLDADLLAAGLQGALHQVVRTYALSPGPGASRLLERLMDVVFVGIGGTS